MGKVFASHAFDMAYLAPHLARGGGVLANLEHNTVAGLIGILEPTIFGNDGTGDDPFPADGFAAPMLTRPTWFAHEPDALRQWTAFLQRVAELDDPDFSPMARRAFEAL